jgi:hypothetical protein
MVLTAYFALSPVIGLFVTVICEFGLSAPGSSRQAFRKLDAGVEASGPHDFAVRISAVRPRAV